MAKGNCCSNLNHFLLPSLIISKDKVKVRHFLAQSRFSVASIIPRISSGIYGYQLSKTEEKPRASKKETAMENFESVSFALF